MGIKARFAFLLILACAGRSETPEELRAMVRQSLARLQESNKKLENYGFIRRSERKEFASGGAVKTDRSWVVQRVPQDGFMIFRLIERDGKPIPEAEQRKNEEIIRKRLQDLKALTPEQIAQRREENRKRQVEEDVWFKEFPEALDYKSAGEESIDGRPALVLECFPRKGYKPKNLRARVFEKVRGRIWIDKAESEIVKAEAEVFDTVSIGWGLVGRVEKGTRFYLQRKKVAPDAWFTEAQIVKFAARMMLVKPLNTEVTTRYSDFRHRSQAVL